VRTALTIIQVIIALGVIVTILLQSGRSAGLSGTIAGGAETFFGKKKGLDELLSKMTAGFAVAFLVVTLALAVMQ
jgi:preprotein translocase subunit SecG